MTRRTPTTPRCAAGSTSANAPDTRLPGPEPAASARFRRAGQRRAAAHRRGHRRPGARPALARAQCPWGRRRRRAAGAAGRGRPERADGAGAGGAAQRCAPRCRGAGRRQRRRRRSWSCACCRRPQAEMRLPCRDRRLHRLLHRHPPRHRGGQAVPARQPAAAQLQVGADRLPRPRVVASASAAGRSCGRSGQTQAGRRRRAAASAPASGWTTSWSSASVDRRGQCAGRADAASAQAEDALFGVALLNDWSARDIQAWEYQPLGPVPGEELRHHASRPGSSRWRRWRRSARPFTRPAGDPQPLPYLDCAGQPRRTARSTSTLEVLAADRGDARSRACRRSGCRSRTSATRYWTRGAAGGAPHRNGCNLQHRRPARHRHAVGPAAGAGRLAAGADAGRQAAADAAQRRDAAASCRTATRVILRALLRARRRPAHRLRRMQRHGAAGVGLMPTCVQASGFQRQDAAHSCLSSDRFAPE